MIQFPYYPHNTNTAAARTGIDATLCGLQFEVCQGDNCYFTLRSLIILCPTYLLFMVMNGGLSTPGGLFMPSIMVGCNSAPLQP